MTILILGGTRFLGRILVETALAKGHQVTLFNRGRTNPTLFADLERIIGDRDNNIELLKGRRWDVVIDTCGYVPRIVKKSVRLLCDSVEQYIFISSINAYSDYSTTCINEDSPLTTLKDETIETVNGETYGPLKVLCEKAAEQVMPGRVFILRCGLIVGKYDPTDRFTYWPVRISQGGEVLAPSPPHVQIQFIDVRDLSEFILLMAQTRLNGIFNTTGPAHKLTMKEFIQECVEVVKIETTITWVNEEFVLQNNVDLPVWVQSEYHGINQVNCQKAIAAGLVFRPLADTVRETLAWHATRATSYELKSGLKAKQEQEFLKTWHNKIS